MTISNTVVVDRNEFPASTGSRLSILADECEPGDYSLDFGPCTSVQDVIELLMKAGEDSTHLIGSRHYVYDSFEMAEAVRGLYKLHLTSGGLPSGMYCLLTRSGGLRKRVFELFTKEKTCV